MPPSHFERAPEQSKIAQIGELVSGKEGTNRRKLRPTTVKTLVVPDKQLPPSFRHSKRDMGEFTLTTTDHRLLDQFYPQS